MTSLFFVYIIHHVALVLGLATSIVVDLFLIIVEKYKRVRSLEKGILHRMLSYSFICALIVFGIEIAHMFLLLMTDVGGVYDTAVYFQNTLSTLLAAILICAIATQKYYHIKTLTRYQEQHHHLSDSFVKHHTEIRNTAILSLLLWISLYICYVLMN
ncbi:MAG: hypothetical protein RJB39_602 [Candidatus Parcubacteria bacterium]|jgi:hypothetical protein